jgi:vacuolar-type H+-ATPase subunit E/Vma4
VAEIALEGILAVIERDCADLCAEIEAHRAAERHAVLAEARAQAERARQAEFEGIAARAERDRLGALHDARLEALRVVADARTEALETVLDRVRTALSVAREDPRYPDLLKHLAGEALKDLAGALANGETGRLSADPRDRQILAGFLESRPPNPTVEFDLVCLGGVLALSPDGRVTVDNTLETRLERAGTSLRAELAQALEAG